MVADRRTAVSSASAKRKRLKLQASDHTARMNKPAVPEIPSDDALVPGASESSADSLLDRLSEAELKLRSVSDDALSSDELQDLPELLDEARTLLLEQRTRLNDRSEHSLRQHHTRDQLLQQSVEQQREARQTINLLSALVDTLPIGLIIADAEGSILTTNKVGAKILGGRVAGSILNPKQHSVVLQIDGRPFSNDCTLLLQRALTDGEISKDIEMSVRTKDEREVVLNVSAAPLRSPRGDIIGAATVFQDATERRRQEQAREALLAELQAEQERASLLAAELQAERDILEAIMEHTRTQLVYLDRDYTFVKVNAAYAEGAGYTRADLVGRNHFDLFDHPENRVIFDQVVATGEAVSVQGRPFTYPHRPELGTTYWDWTLVPVFNSEREVQGLVLSLIDVTERHRDEARIASLARFPAENPHPVLRVSQQGKLTYANAGSADLLKTWGIAEGDYVPEEWQTRIRETVERQTFSTAEVECDACVFSITIAPSQEGDVNLYGRDITDLRRTQQALHQYASRLRILHRIDQAILSAESIEAVANSAFEHLSELIDYARASVALFDFDSDELVLLAVQTKAAETEAGKGWRIPLTHEWPKQLNQLRRGKAAVIENLSTVDEASPLIDVFRAEGAHGMVRQPLLIHGEVIGTLNLGLEDSGPPSRLVIELAREVADQLALGIHQATLHRRIQEHAEQLERRVAWRTAALRISEARFRAMFEDAPTGIALLDQDGLIIQGNAALETILGLESGELRDTTLVGRMHPDDAEKQLELYTPLMQGASERYRIEARFIRPNQQQIWCNVTVSLVRDVEHQPRLAIAMVEDITERRKAQAALVQTEKLALTGQLAASFAHEINNPLQTVIGCLGLADETVGGEEPVGTYLQMASEELKRAANIVAKLRDLNRKSRPEEKELIQVRDLLDHVLSMTHKQTQDRHIEVRLAPIDTNLPRIRAVPDRLEQVFLNLTLNAIDAMSQGGMLSVSLLKTEAPLGVTVRLRDTGAGIVSEDQARLFDPFHTTKAEGLGLGLFISQSIVEEHGGRIEVESLPGIGTTFTIWLPAFQE